MKKLIGKILLVLLGIAILEVMLFFIALWKNSRPMAEDYYETTPVYGTLEEKYNGLGPYSVSYLEFPAGDTLEKYEIYYPSDLETSKQSYPVVIMVNGTGISGSRYGAVMRRLASWGFIVAGNEDENSRNGASSTSTLDFLLTQNEAATSVFFQKINTERIGIAGHSQGGVGAVNAATQQANGSLYRALYIASPASAFWGREDTLGLDWSYDTGKLTAPVFLMAGTGKWDAGTTEDALATEGQGISPLWSLRQNYEEASSCGMKVMARRADADHGDMLYYGDGYMTAWFLYHLCGDAEAGTVFLGEAAEIKDNPLWQDVQIDMEGAK